MIAYFNKLETKKIISRLREKNVVLENIKNINAETGKLAGKIFVITGKLPSGKKRNELSDIIVENGGNVSGSAAKNISFLIAGEDESKSSKYKKAVELKIPIISESQFYEMIK